MKNPEGKKKLWKETSQNVCMSEISTISDECREKTK
jgi:hypothetical protein